VTGEHLIEDNSEGENVRAVVGRKALNLLGRHVDDGAEESPGLGLEGSRWRFGREVLFGQLQLGKPEVEDLDAPVSREEHIFGLEVTVDDALVVCRGQAIGDGARVLDRFARGEPPSFDHLPKRLAIEQLHDGVGDSFLGAEIVDREDIWMVEFRYSFCLALETSEAVGVGSHLLQQYLDRHITVEPLVACAVDHPHPARADLLDDAVVAKRATDEVSHCSGSRCGDVIAVICELRDCRQEPSPWICSESEEKVQKTT